jgi:hemoglobin-like flavoprotein
MLTATQIDLVQSSFQRVLPIAETAGLLLYERIFALAPEARELFADDIRPQAKRTIAAVKTAVDGLDDLERVTPGLVRLGARHVRYGVRPEHFDVVGAALMWTLEHGIGPLDAATRDAWAEVWELVAGAMLIGLLQAEAELHDTTELATAGAEAR